MEDEAEIYDGVRAQFPLTFGKQSKPQTPLESVHSATRRHGPNPNPAASASSPSPSLPSTASASAASAGKSSGLPSLSSSSRAWLEAVRAGNPRRDHPEAGIGSRGGDGEDGDRAVIGPPRPPPGLNSNDDGGGEDDDDDDGVMVGPPPPPPGNLVDGDDDEEEEEVMIGPPRPPNVDSDEEEEEEENQYRIPLSNEIVLKGHTKVVAALAVDPTGSRVLSGSYDYSVRMYDFQGMNSRLSSFRDFEPFEGHQVRNLSWSPTADRFLCVTGSAQAKIYDRDGLTLGEFMKGDMYIRDLKNTKGHISGLTWGEWHPKTKETILTSSEDGSLRIWDVNDFKSQKQIKSTLDNSKSESSTLTASSNDFHHPPPISILSYRFYLNPYDEISVDLSYANVIKPKLARPGRVPVTTCTWDREGKCIAGGIGDGSIQIWNLKPGWGSRPDIHVEKAHSDDITGLKFSSDRKILLTRSYDGSLKVWDLRLMKNPLKVFEDLPNHYAQTNIAFSPDEQLFLTGTSVERESTTGGLLCFFDRSKLELISRIGISPTCSVVQCAWHPRLNQIFATSGDKSQGGTHVLYDPTLSERGALVCVARAPRKKSVDDFELKPVIHNPHALPLFRDQPSRKRQREKILKDPLKSHKPEVPMNGPGHGGRIGTTKGSLLTQYLLKQGGLIKETWMEEDPREAILKYADVAENDPKFIAPAYAQTQPEPVFAKSDSEDEEK